MEMSRKQDIHVAEAERRASEQGSGYEHSMANIHPVSSSRQEAKGGMHSGCDQWDSWHFYLGRGTSTVW